MSYKLPNDNDRLDIYEDSAGEWRWRLKAANNETIADSAEGYETRGGAERAASRVFPVPAPVPPPAAPSVMPPVAPVQGRSYLAAAILLAVFAVGFILGWLLGQDDDRRGRDEPAAVTTTSVVSTPEGTFITDGTTSIVSTPINTDADSDHEGPDDGEAPTTTASLSPSGDPPPSP